MRPDYKMRSLFCEEEFDSLYCAISYFYFLVKGSVPNANLPLTVKFRKLTRPEAIQILDTIVVKQNPDASEETKLLYKTVPGEELIAFRNSIISGRPEISYFHSIIEKIPFKRTSIVMTNFIVRCHSVVLRTIKFFDDSSLENMVQFYGIKLVSERKISREEDRSNVSFLTKNFGPILLKISPV